MFVIKLKSGGFIAAGEPGKGYIVCDSLSDAKIWKTKTKAENVLRSSIPKQLKQECFVTALNYEVVEESWAMNQLSSLQETISKIHDECGLHMRELYDSLSRVDKELEDIIHYVENTDLNACDGYKAFKMIQIKRRERRRIKISIQEASIANGIYRINEEIEQMLCEIYDANQHKNYHPRCYPELFKRDSREILYGRISGEKDGQQIETA